MELISRVAFSHWLCHLDGSAATLLFPTSHQQIISMFLSQCVRYIVNVCINCIESHICDNFAFNLFEIESCAFYMRHHCRPFSARWIRFHWHTHNTFRPNFFRSLSAPFFFASIRWMPSTDIVFGESDVQLFIDKLFLGELSNLYFTPRRSHIARAMYAVSFQIAAFEVENSKEIVQSTFKCK